MHMAIALGCIEMIYLANLILFYLGITLSVLCMDASGIAMRGASIRQLQLREQNGG